MTPGSRRAGATAGRPGVAAGRGGVAPGAGGPSWPRVEPVRSQRIYADIVRQIRGLVADGQVTSGDRLPPERELAERFGVSRTSVREAMRALESTGLIEIRPGEGTFVREVSVEALVEPLARVMLAQRQAIAELYEARRLLEPPIAALAARRATPEECGELTRILDEQAREVASGRTGLAQDAAFHAAIAHSAHNRAISRVVSALLDLLSQSREESLQSPGRPRRSHGDHRRILAAIRVRDPEGAEAAMRDHLLAVERLVVDREARGLSRRPGSILPADPGRVAGPLRPDRGRAAPHPPGLPGSSGPSSG